MPVNLNKDGTFEVSYNGPWTGINVQSPENLLKDTDSPASNDFIYRNAELRSRFTFGPGVVISPNTAQIITAVGSLNGVLWAILGSGGLYKFSGGVWTLVAGSAAATVSNWRIFNNILYITDAANSKLHTWDGTTYTDNIAVQGATTIGSIFIDELDQHLLMADTNESGTNFPVRLRWSATALPTQWDPTVNTNAGFNDFIDVPDTITGTMMLGRVGYVLRPDGITEISPTGQGAAPFQFNHLWANQNGLGNTKFYGAFTYGNTGVLIARDNLYALTSYDLQPIGGTARDAILADLGTTTGIEPSLSNVFGVITPYMFSGAIPDSGLTIKSGSGGSFPYLQYLLFINKTSSCRAWAYSFEGGYWEQYNFPNLNVTGLPALSTVVGGALTLTVPVINTNSNLSGIAAFGATSFNDGSQGSSHTFRSEEIAPGRVVTIDRIVMTYRDIGQFTLTLTVNGSDDNGAVVSATTTVTLGGLSDNKLKVALIYPQNTLAQPFTGFLPALTLTRAANGGQVSIAKIQMLGRINPAEFS